MSAVTFDDIEASGEISANDLVTAKNMADLLHKQYPGHLWAVTCDWKQGVATIRNLALSGIWGYVIKLRDHFSATALDHEVKKAGGEILERFKLARGKANAEAVNQGIEFAVNGHAIGDYGSAKTPVPDLLKN